MTPTPDTPPQTDASQVDTESEFLSDIYTSDAESDFVSDIEHDRLGGNLSVISEAPSSPTAWSVIGGTDLELDQGFAASIESLTLDGEAGDAESRTRGAGVYVRTRTRWNEPRSASSPSRSPARRHPPIRRAVKVNVGKETFYNYLFG